MRIVYRRIDRVMTPARLYQSRLRQIRAAYNARIPAANTLTKLTTLNRERARQIRLAGAERDKALRQKAIQKGIKKVSKRKVMPRRRTAVSQAKKASRFWKHFARDGSPVSPWEISVGPGMDIDDDDASAMDEPLFAEGDYDYDDFDADWGGYEYEDTGYPDEDA